MEIISCAILQRKMTVGQASTGAMGSSPELIDERYRLDRCSAVWMAEVFGLVILPATLISGGADICEEQG
jgi:hypothetical protein